MTGGPYIRGRPHGRATRARPHAEEDFVKDELVYPREVSLGASIIASGIVRRPLVAANDPLAPIRRMSQAEKIAFFS